MKKFLLATNLILAGFIFFQACHHSKDDIKDGKEPSRTSPTSFCADTACAQNASNTLKGMIKYATAKKMCDDYGRDMNKKMIYLNGQPTKMEDSRNIWFDLQKLKNFIAFIEKEACTHGCNSRSSFFGIRVYLAKYPSAAEIAASEDLKDGVKPEFANHTTVFFSPTYYDPITQKNIDFDPSEIKDNCKLHPINPSKEHVWFGFLPGDPVIPGAGSNQQNHGDLKPPPDGEGAFPEL